MRVNNGRRGMSVIELLMCNTPVSIGSDEVTIDFEIFCDFTKIQSFYLRLCL